MKSLKGKNIVLTGGAGGIGKELAILLAKEKANLALIDINKAALEKIGKELKSFGIIANTYICDISDITEVKKTAKKINDDFPHIDILVNNAGIVIGKKTYEETFNDVKKVVSINFLGLVAVTQQFLPEMIKRNSGQIINIASAMGLLAIPKMSSYVASKFAIIGYSDTLRIEMKKFGHTGVKVTIICPTGIDTGMFKGYKPPILTSLLKPVKVAEKIIKGIKKESAYVKIPFSTKIIPLLKGMPAPFVDWLANLIGVGKSMDDYHK